MDWSPDYDDLDTNPIVAFVVGIFLGCTVGAIAMWLLAPRKGSRTRKKIRSRGREFGREAADTFGDAVTQVKHGTRRGREAVADKADELHDRGENIFDEQRERVESVLEAGKNRIRRS